MEAEVTRGEVAVEDEDAALSEEGEVAKMVSIWERQPWKMVPLRKKTPLRH